MLLSPLPISLLFSLFPSAFLLSPDLSPLLPRRSIISAFALPYRGLALPFLQVVSKSHASLVETVSRSSSSSANKTRAMDTSRGSRSIT
eukprot:374623-Hanusia_phi.AAC.2